MVVEAEFPLVLGEKKRRSFAEKMPSERFCFSHWNKIGTSYVGKD